MNIKKLYYTFVAYEMPPGTHIDLNNITKPLNDSKAIINEYIRHKHLRNCPLAICERSLPYTIRYVVQLKIIECFSFTAANLLLLFDKYNMGVDIEQRIILTTEIF